MTDVDVVKNAQRLHHIILAVQRIRRSMADVTWELFAANEDKQGNVVRCLEIIGEAANHVAAEIRDVNPDMRLGWIHFLASEHSSNWEQHPL